MIGPVRTIGLVVLAAVVQVASIGGAKVLGATPDLLLVVVILIAWSRGSLAGSASGFVGGLLVDVTTLDHLGISALVLTLAGYWAGRYGETTGRGRPAAAYLTVAVLTVAAGIGSFLLHVVVGETVDAGRAFGPLLPAVLVNLALAFAVRHLVRLFGGAARRATPAPPQGDPIG